MRAATSWSPPRSNGQPVRFLVDSGASHVVLSAGDAERLGLRVSERDFTEIYRTPGGIVRAAPVMLGEVRIGDLAVRDVRASISGLDMDGLAARGKLPRPAARLRGQSRPADPALVTAAALAPTRTNTSRAAP